MTLIHRALRRFLFGSLVAVTFCVPVFAQAKILKKKSVKRVTALSSPAPADPKKAPSRCLGTGMRRLYDDATKLMEKDIVKAGEGHDDAIKQYRDNMQLVWGAMNQPYCGYGTRGLSAVRHSFDKTINRTRTVFLKAIKVSSPALQAHQ